MVPKSRSYTFGTILLFDVLEGLAPEDSHQDQEPMDIEGELSVPAPEATQVPLELAIAMPLWAADASSFDGLVNRPLEPVGLLLFSSCWHFLNTTSPPWDCPSRLPQMLQIWSVL